MTTVLHIPGIYRRPTTEPDPATAADIDRHIDDWVAAHDLCPPQWRTSLTGFRLGSYVCAAHPRPASFAHLLVAAKLLLAENIVDDTVCEDHGGSPEGLGGRLLLAHSALDPSHSTTGYEKQWRHAIDDSQAYRSYRLAMDDLAALAGPSVADRERQDLARLHMGYLAEAANTLAQRVPPVWEYLTLRQMNSFRPCLSIVDAIDGYEIAPAQHAQEAVQKVLALAALASTLANDLYSYTKELRCPRPHVNLPVVIAAEQHRDAPEAYAAAVDLHNQVMYELESASSHVTRVTPALTPYIAAVGTWVDGNHAWHATNTDRYSLPDFL